MSEAVKRSILKKMSGKRQKFIFAGILAVAVMHFVVQMSFIQSENLRSVEISAQIEGIKSEETGFEKEPAVDSIVEIKPEESEIRKVKIRTVPARSPNVSRRPETIAQPQSKRKVVRETREARLRRAEKILTGV